MEYAQKPGNSFLNCDLGFSDDAVGNTFLWDWVYQCGFLQESWSRSLIMPSETSPVCCKYAAILLCVEMLPLRWMIMVLSIAIPWNQFAFYQK